MQGAISPPVGTTAPTVGRIGDRGAQGLARRVPRSPCSGCGTRTRTPFRTFPFEGNTAARLRQSAIGRLFIHGASVGAYLVGFCGRVSSDLHEWRNFYPRLRQAGAPEPGIEPGLAVLETAFSPRDSDRALLLTQLGFCEIKETNPSLNWLPVRERGGR